MNPTPAPSRVRVPELDGIRGLAIGLVLYAHFVPYSIASGTGPVVNFLRRTLALGSSGVDLFFVLSGFLIGGILMDHRNSENYFKSFYIRRCCRILPPYLICLALYLIFRWLLTTCSSQAWYDELFVQGGMPFWANLVQAQNYVGPITGHFNPDWLNVNWSLGLEEQFYLVLPLAIWLLRPSQLVKILVVLVCLSPLMQFFLCVYSARAYIAVSSMMPTRADDLLIGVICAFVLRQDKVQTWVAQNTRCLRWTFIFLMLGFVWLLTKYDLATFEYERILFFNLWIALFYACLVVLAVTEKDGIISVAMRCRTLCWLGMISYSVYLFHMPINGLMHGLLLGRDSKYRKLSDVFVTVLALIVILLFGTVLWRVLEKPIITWGHSFSYGGRKNNICVARSNY